jgi:hypothetical protein
MAPGAAQRCPPSGSPAASYLRPRPAAAATLLPLDGSEMTPVETIGRVLFGLAPDKTMFAF